MADTSNYTIYTPTALSGSYFGLSLAIAETLVTGAGEVSVQWQRQVTPVRLPNQTANHVDLVVGRLEGKANIRSFYVIGDNPPISELDITGTPTTTQVTINVGASSVVFDGYYTGKGFTFSPVAARCWNLRAGVIVKLKDADVVGS